MADVSVHIDARDYAKFQNALHKIAEITNKSMWRLLQTTAIYAFQSARKLSPLGKKRRPVRRATKEEKKANKGMPLVMEWWNKNGTMEWRPVATRDDKARDIKYRGAAKNSWSGLIGRVGKAEAVEAQFRNVAYNGTQMIKQREGNKPFIVALNRLGYMLKLVPTIEDQALSLAMSRVVGAEMKKLGDQAEQIWSN